MRQAIKGNLTVHNTANEAIGADEIQFTVSLRTTISIQVPLWGHICLLGVHNLFSFDLIFKKCVLMCMRVFVRMYVTWVRVPAEA